MVSAYELVIVENVWANARITIIQDPLKTMRYTPTGAIRLIDWRERVEARPSNMRVIELNAPAP